MNVLSKSDFLEVKLNSLIADYDRDIITNLYQPIIGYAAISVYFSLWSEANNQKVVSIITHENLLMRMQMPVGIFVDNRKLLEAVGLLRSYVDSTTEINIYRYELYAPKTPKLFFDNALLYGMLIKSLGEVDANKLKDIYKIGQDINYGEDVSANFQEVFHPEFDDPAFMKAANSKSETIGRNSSKITKEFSYETFFKTLESVSQISSKAFLKKDMKEIERLATLYGVDENVAANSVANLYDSSQPSGKRIDFSELAKAFQDETHYAFIKSKNISNIKHLVSSKTDKAQMINDMERYSPKDYLSVLQNGTKPAGADLRLIDDLSRNFQLPNCVINVIINYVLTKNNNMLSRALSEKIAASIARENLTTAVDTMNYLKRVNKPRNERNKVSYTKTESVDVTNEDKKENIQENKQEKNEVSWDQLLDDIDEGDDNGKA